MAWCIRGPWMALGLLLLAGVCDAAKPYRWAFRFPSGCEPPNQFYSSRHVHGVKPCCPTSEGACPGGLACPANGVCTDGKACKPSSIADRPNVVLFVSDDQGYCDYGFSGECRSERTGSPIPPPKTPTLDLLAGHGTVFPVAHNSSSWCFPSLATMFTGRYQKSMSGSNKIDQAFFSTIPSALRALETDPGAQADPYNAGNAIGGYCTLLAGKFTPALDENAFDAMTVTTRKLGRNGCVASGGSSAPDCGPSLTATYSPLVASPENRLANVFEFLQALVYKHPASAPGSYTMQHFFLWFAPRIPHQPVRPPQAVGAYLFGGGNAFPLGGVLDLGQWCVGGACPPFVSAFAEGQFGKMYDYYSAVWWTDDNVRELRRFMAEMSSPHCFDSTGRSRFDVTSPAQCNGTWGAVAPDLSRSTIFMYLSDNGWQLPNSKHAFSENGYRTQLVVFDPRTLPNVPSWDPELLPTPPPPQRSEALVHSVDLLPTVLGFATGTPGSQSCPSDAFGTPCDGHDLRPHLATAPGGPAAPETLRHSLCGHQTSRVTVPGRHRYLLTRPGSVGRCTAAASPACASASDCGAGQFCVGGHCAPALAETSCTQTSDCPAGAACLGSKCLIAPVCLEDGDCAGLVGPGYVCAAKEQRWCRNAPNVACATTDDCPVCPSSNGVPMPCGRSCEARMLKLYLAPSVSGPEAYFLTDLFADPDEHHLYDGVPRDPTFLLTSMSDLNGPYGNAIRRMNCCIDDWWPEGGATGTLCTSGFSCPADLACNQ